MSQFRTESDRWAAVQSHNPVADGQFVYGVKTTMIYCRPVCSARLARRANVVFHDNAAAAAAAGFRPCKRCKPELEAYDPQKAVIAEAVRTIKQADAADKAVPSLGELAEEAGLTRSHFHRVFKKITGVTPKMYASNLRAEKQNALSPSDTTLSQTSSVRSPMVGPSIEDCNTSSTPSSEVTCYEVGEHTASTFVLAQYESELTARPDLESLNRTVLDTAELFPAGPSRSSKNIEYTIQPWYSSFVLIAVTRDGICSLDSGDSIAELVETLRSRFPAALVTGSAWPVGVVEDNLSRPEYAIFSAIMEGLLSPTGRILNIPFDTQ